MFMVGTVQCINDSYLSYLSVHSSNIENALSIRLGLINLVAKNFIFSVSRETESTTGSGSDNDQLPKCIRREVAKLSDKWSALLTQVDLWQRRLDDTLPVSIRVKSYITRVKL